MAQSLGNALTINRKLTISTLSVLLLLLVIGLITFERFTSLGEMLDTLDVRTEVQRKVLSINYDLASIHSQSYQIIAWASSGFSEDRMESQVKDIVDRLESTRKELAAMSEDETLADEHEALVAISESVILYADELVQGLDMATIDATTASMMMQSADRAFTTLKEQVATLVDLEEKSTMEVEEAAHVAMDSARFIIGILFCIAITVGLVLNLLIARSITSPARRIIDYAGKVAGGTLDARPEGDFSAEMADLRASIEAMVGNLKDKMAEADERSKEAAEQARKAQQAMDSAMAEKERVQGLLVVMSGVSEKAVSISSELASAAEELATQASEISNSSDIQRGRVQETSTSMEEMSATVLEVTKSASQAAEGSDAAREKAMEGAGIVGQVMAVTASVQTQAQEMSEGLAELGHRADAIGRIMEVINDIADQTNLLALNAAIEAARAGEAGRGFAVVADEVRKLAEKTMNATKEVGDAIRSIQEGTRESIASMKGASEAVGKNAVLARQAEDALAHIVELINSTADQVRSIATAAEEQSASAEEINRSTADVYRLSTETSDMISRSSEAIHVVAALAEQLQEIIAELERCKGDSG
ncbi:methyl-accepting chemotaxis protein [Desulfovibrio mangrovi]|uniref:methyl-accepting chemotaxis protein n=1 Tax=Desulfovibrio mangrovi TaxID=2976983 RepID=UPI002247C4E7|nr:methyl-accepting chemotaxis protein [Desulfovibrio mangrovi]UZP69104.1 methyl-accepting chemotaxis protein [Desulfovibrio mangrovi]